MNLLDLFKKVHLEMKGVEDHGAYCLLHLRVPEDLKWAPGTYAQFSLVGDPERRFLTIASCPSEKEILLLIRKGSSYKSKLIQASPGTLIQMKSLVPFSVPDQKGVPFICFASNVGIAAIRPFVKEGRDRSIEITYLDKGCQVFDQEMQEHMAVTNSFVYTKWPNMEQALEDMHQKVVKYGKEALYLLAGTPTDVREMANFLKKKGIPPKNIKKQSFAGLT